MAAPQAMLYVGAGGTAVQQLMVKNTPAATDTDNIMYIGTNAQVKKSQLNNTNVVVRRAFALNNIASGTTGTVTITDAWPDYMLTVSGSNACSINQVATFMVNNENITCLTGIVGAVTYTVTDVGTAGKALKLSAIMPTACSGTDVNEFDFTISISGNTIQIHNDNAGTMVNYTINIISA